MKKTSKLTDNTAIVTLHADNGKTLTLDFKTSGLKFMNVLELISIAEKQKDSDNMEKAGSAMVSIFAAVKKLITADKFDEIIDFCDENDEEFEIADFVMLVDIRDAVGDVPKG